MKVLVCFMPELIFEHKFEPLGTPPMVIYLLYSVLKNAGYEADLIDPFEFYKFEKEENVIKACFNYIDSKISDEDIICFSSNTFNWGLSRQITNMLVEKHPSLRIIHGGLHPSIFDRYVLEITKARLVIRTEGEKKLVEVINALENNYKLSEIAGITYRVGDEIIRNPDDDYLTLEELESSPLPDFSLLPKKARYVNIPIESSRGCKFSCAFCSIPHRHNWRGVCVEELERRVVNTLKYKDRFPPIANILFVDDCFTANTERAKLVASKMKEWGEKRKYFIEVRASDVVKSDLFDHLDNGLIYSMQVGVECGYDEGLKKIRKGLTIDRLYSALETLHARGFSKKMFLSFIIGFPWEGYEEISRTLDTVEDIATRFGILCNLNWLYLLPSDLWYERDIYGISVDESIFDDPLWISNKDVFFKTHPLVTDDIINKVELRVAGIKEKDIPVNLNPLAFRHMVDLVERFYK